MSEFTSCPKCDYHTTEAVTFCQQCGGKMLSSSKVRKLGWLAVIAGAFLVVMMTFIVIWELSPHTLFTGTREMARFAIAIESVIVIFGVTAIFAGVWQIKHGKRNKTLTYITLGLAAVLIMLAVGQQMNSGD